MTDSLHIALLAPPFESVPPRLYGGTERVVDPLARGLVLAGPEVSVFASADSHPAGRLIPITDTALRLREPPVQDPSAIQLSILLKLQQRLTTGHWGTDSGSRPIDVIHNHNDFWMFPLLRGLKVPMITTMHGRLDLPDYTPAWKQADGSHGYVSISMAQRQPVPDLPWLGNIAHGLPLEQYPYHPMPGSYLAFLGRICPEKRPEWAIQIAKQSGIPLKIAAKIEGKAGRDWYDQMLKPHVDGRFIEYVGEISDREKGDFLGNALGLAFPIDWPEPFGLVMIEALACGTPVLARPCGSVTEVLTHGRTGFIASDIQELGRLARELPALSRANCRHEAEVRFSLTRMTEDYLNAYRRIRELGEHRESRH